ncbi:hypothetical protein Tco_1370892 [Tanacetum coccineum]
MGPSIPIYPNKKTKEGMVDSQHMEEEIQEAKTKDVGMETHAGPTKPVLQAHKTPSPSSAFIKEKIDVLRTMIKEHDQQAKIKAMPRRLAYADSDKQAPARLLARDFSDRFSLESSGTSDTHKQTRSASKNQRTASKNKEPTHLRRSRRLEDRSITKEKARRERSKSRRKRSEHQEISSDSEQEEDPTEIYGIKRRQNKGLQAFMDRLKSKSSHIKGVPPVLRILAFMHGHGHPKLAKKLNDKIPKTVDEMFERVRAFIRGEVATCSAEMVRPSQGDKGYVHLVDPKKLEIEDIRQNNQRGRSQRRNNVKVINMIREGGSCKWPFEEERSGLTDELTFPTIPRNQLTDEPIILEGVIEGRSKTVLMEFAIIKCRSPYKVIIGRTGMRSLRAVGSTIHSMIKFLTNQGIVTMETSREAPWECRHLERVQDVLQENIESEGRKVSWPYGNKGRSLNEVRDSRRIWLDEQSRRSPLKDKKEIEQITNTGYSKGRRNSDAMSTAKK